MLTIILEVLPMAAFGSIVLAFPKFWKAIVLLCIALLPFSLGNVGPYRELLISEWLPVALLPATLGGILKAGRPLFSRQSWVLVAALVLFGLLALANALRFSAIADNYLRAYWQIACGLMLFFEVSWYGLSLPKDSRRLKKGLWVLVGVAFVASAARLAGHYSGATLPLLAKTFTYSTQTAVASGALVDRIGGLAEATTLGICALGALVQMRAAGKPALLMLAWFAAMVVLSGGRAFAAAVVVVALLYILLSTSRRRLRATAAALVTAIVSVAVLSLSGFSSQLARLTAFSGGLAEQDPYRYAAMQAQLQQFKVHPFLGKGLGVLPGNTYSAFVSEQVSLGGHAAYTSILANFGVVGGLFMAAMLLVPLFGAWRLQRGLGWQVRSRPVVALTFFVMLEGAIRLVTNVAGGNGYSDMGLYVNAGLFAACLCAARPRKRESA